MRRRVVVTGIGIVSPIGNDPETVWRALMEGRSGTGTIQRFAAHDLPSRVAGEVREFDATEYLPLKEARRTDRFVQFAVAAAKDALQSARLEVTTELAERTGVLIGSALGGVETFEQGIEALRSRGPGKVSPFMIPMFLADMAGGYVAIETGARGPNFATLSACASGANAIGEGMRMIREGRADIVVAGGSEAPLTRGVVAGFAALQALSRRNDEAETASRPFDRTRDGFVIAEGAAVLVLEAEDVARRRGAPILAELVGYGTTADAYHIVQPCSDGTGALAAMCQALADAELQTDDIDYVNAHGTSTPLNDIAETAALKRLFGGRNNVPPVSSTKALTGHLLGAAGALEAVICVLALQHQVIPPTWHLREPDPECDLDYVANEPRVGRLRYVMTNAFGFGGHNAVLILGRYSAS
ncbi:beta-ketoacyl-ACP synthase II [Thermomicrobium sp. 4228-Ro]|uniref:beta-ketoacyl-ACP synthase II n=1 Tax=Thermomicrobium sp. 4228-Ro TaxID=2993937 RepID=UPI002248D75E|nr:beta-ketoacyl-ACP synthase II [Thermomicrobium sp. 4228-Ro]MCX2726116.1 beta-ketoacyl-ACP synthase II [Thermomicrobium sp. 4228-Ro]